MEALDANPGGLIEAGVDALIVHARKAWLKGLSPRENRDIPPLDHALVHRLKGAYPYIPIILNGGLETLEAAHAHLMTLDGVMIGRAAYHHPDMLRHVDSTLFDVTDPYEDARDALATLLPYIDAHLERGGRLHGITRHLHGFFAARRGARAFRRYLATECIKPEATSATFAQALDLIAPLTERAEYVHAD